VHSLERGHLVKEFSEVLTALLGSDRSGADLALLLVGLSAALLLFTCRKMIVEAIVNWFASKVKIAEQRAQACTLLASALSAIQDAQASAHIERNDIRDTLARLAQAVDKLAADKPEVRS